MDIINFLKPLIINGLDELNTLCSEYNIGIDDDTFRPGLTLKYLGSKLKNKHRYIYLQLDGKDINSKEKDNITYIDCFIEIENNIFNSVNPNTGVAFIINIVD